MPSFCKAVVYLLVALPAVAQSQAFAKITIRSANSAVGTMSSKDTNRSSTFLSNPAVKKK